MALRTVDIGGTTWTIWDVYPSAEGVLRQMHAGELATGWLAFECTAEKRRLAPIPEGWEEWTEEALGNALVTAMPVRRMPCQDD